VKSSISALTGLLVVTALATSEAACGAPPGSDAQVELERKQLDEASGQNRAIANVKAEQARLESTAQRLMSRIERLATRAAKLDEK
jgi:hypothetical protein